MVFVFIFVIGVFTLAFLGEVYKKGKDNILSQSKQEIVTSDVYLKLSSKFGNFLGTAKTVVLTCIIIFIGIGFLVGIFYLFKGIVLLARVVTALF
jgi:hypothetical protein